MQVVVELLDPPRRSSNVLEPGKISLALNNPPKGLRCEG
jgi:hypothetical protein